MAEPPGGVALSSNAITAVSGPGSSVGVFYMGGSLANWDGTNNSGNPVLNGVYYFQITTAGPNGVVTSINQQVTVTRSFARASVLVYNEAGEVVKHLYASEGAPLGTEMTNVDLSSAAFTPGNQNASGNVQILVHTSGGGSITLSWDGTADNGSPVTPGVYELGVHWDDGKDKVSDITQEIVVRPGSGTSGTVVAQPNVLGPGTGSVVTLKASPGQGLTLNFRIYTVAGEFVPVVPGPSGPDLVQFDASKLASGLYLVEVEGLNSSNQILLRQIVKFTVHH